ncbi:MAG: DUF6448 family protein [Actinomycetota bacterium]
MPPHCDSLDGPVVLAARAALDSRQVDVVLPYVPADGEAEVRAAFAAVLPVRGLGPEAREVADRLFFETVVRVHRAGEGAPFTGLQPAGLDHGPVIPLAERAVETGSVRELADHLTAVLHEELESRLERVTELRLLEDRSVEDARRYVEAMLGFQVYAHHLLDTLRSSEFHEAATSSAHQH